jgi:Uma2 family endonuclease
MGTKTLIPVEEYLRTSYEGVDREYVRGELVERGMPLLAHGRIQARLASVFGKLEKEFGLYACTETRMRLGADVIRIPDVAVFHPDLPSEPVPSQPPLIVIEILSPDDRHSEVHEKLEEYRMWGVPKVWLIDPQLHKLYVYDGGLRTVNALELSEPPVRLEAAEIFA